MTWEVEITDAYQEWWHTLTESERIEIAAVVEILEEIGPQLKYPYSSGIKGSRYSHMRELRIQVKGNPLRIFYAFDPRRVPVLLIGGNKVGKEKNFYRNHISIADRLYEQHLVEIGHST